MSLVELLDDAAVRSALQQQGLVMEVDLGGCGDKAALMQAFAQALQLPEGFGHNWDALADVLRDRLGAEDERRILLICGTDSLQSASPPDHAMLREVISDLADEFDPVPPRVYWVESPHQQPKVPVNPMTMAVGLLVIGDEILSGKRQDRHMPFVIDQLAARGMALDYVRFIGDDAPAIAAAMRDARHRGDLLLSCGGIGATPDDCTRQAAALAYDLPLLRHPEGEALIVTEYGDKAFPNRVLMADFPQGATLIPNPINRVAGFSIGHTHCVPGFPEMAWPMLEWVLDTLYRHLHNAAPAVEYRLRVMGTAGEGDLLALMQATLAAHPGLKLSSLPCRGDAQRPRHIEFGFKGPPEMARAGFEMFHRGLERHPAAEVVELLSPPP